MGEIKTFYKTPVRDIKLVKENAVHIIHVLENGTVEVIENDHPRLDVLAVTGSYQTDKWDLEEAVLLEIGMNRTRAYNQVHIPAIMRKSGEPVCFTTRHHGFSPTIEQYQAAAPYIFKYLESRAAAQISTRKNGWEPYRVKALGNHNTSEQLQKPILGKRSGVKVVPFNYGVPPLVRFTARLSDQFLINDIYWAELYGNQKLQNQLVGLGNEIRTLLDTAVKKARGTPSDWLKSQYFAAAMVKFERFTQSFGDRLNRDRSYLQKILLRDYVGEKHYLFDEVAQRLDWHWSNPITEELLAKQTLPDPQSRLQGIQIKIWRPFNNHLSFDVYPRKPTNEEEIPF